MLPTQAVHYPVGWLRVGERTGCGQLCVVFRCMVDVTVTIKFKVALAHQIVVLSLNLALTQGI